MEDIQSFTNFINEEIDHGLDGWPLNQDAGIERRLDALYNRGLSGMKGVSQRGDKEFIELVDIVQTIYKMIR